jgi:mono/diheme cytochrome c family protein
MSRLKLRAALLLAIAAPLTAAYMGGWASITVENLPDSVLAGQPTNMTFSVRQHGERLLSGLKPVVTGVSGDHEFRAGAVETNKAGYYTVTLSPAQTGDWTFTIRSGFNNDAAEGRLKLMPIAALASNARPVALTQEARGQRLFVAKGCVTCHTQKGIDPIETRVGRIDLSDRHLPADYLEQFLKDPSVKKAWSTDWRMPDLDLKPAEITSLVAFLQATQPARKVSASN